MRETEKSNHKFADSREGRTLGWMVTLAGVRRRARRIG